MISAGDDIGKAAGEAGIVRSDSGGLFDGVALRYGEIIFLEQFHARTINDVKSESPSDGRAIRVVGDTAERATTKICAELRIHLKCSRNAVDGAGGRGLIAVIFVQDARGDFADAIGGHATNDRNGENVSA